MLIAGALVAALAVAMALASLCRYACCGQLSAGGRGARTGAGAIADLLANQPLEPAGTEGDIFKSSCEGLLLASLTLPATAGY